MSRLLSLLLLLSPMAPFALAQTATPGPAYELRVDGMSCPLCVYGVEKQLHKLDGVDTVTTDLAQGRIVIAMRDDTPLDRSQVEQAIRDAGFNLRTFEPVPTKPKP